jgi:hypothetical protein
MYDPDHPERPAQDRRQSIPPTPSRQDALGRLRTERWHATGAGETSRVAEIDREIERLSAASSPVPPGRETTSATPPTRERRATPPSTQRKKR